MKREALMAELYQHIGSTSDDYELFDDEWVDRVLTITYLLSAHENELNNTEKASLSLIATAVDSVTAGWGKDDDL